MQLLDWIVLFGALAVMVLYGIWKSERNKNLEGYLLANRQIPWYMVGLGAMATQASAITFLSTTGQGYSDGMGFVQFYFGLPLAMIVLCVSAVPIFHRLHIFTAYEYLEKRFDLKTRSLAALLFLVQRALSTGISIYAPALVLSTLLGWDLFYTNLITGGIVIVYTLTGGVRAVAYTQMQQMLIIWTGMFLALGTIIYLLPKDISLWDTLRVAGKLNHLEAVTTHLDLNNKYTLWTGIIGGFFLQLSYFGTDQSQVQRYLTGASVTESRMGLLLNGLIKIPMQVIILFVGVMVFMFYQFNTPPIYFNNVLKNKVYKSAYADEFKQLENEYELIHLEKTLAVKDLASAIKEGDQAKITTAHTAVIERETSAKEIREKAVSMLSQVAHEKIPADGDYVFLTFVMKNLPTGLVGLLIAVIFAASMSSIGAAFSALTSTTLVDIYKRMFVPNATEKHYVLVSKISTVGWGLFCILMAGWAAQFGNLIEAVNVLGSLFYGTILGIFVVGFYMKSCNANATFWAAVIAEIFVIIIYRTTGISYLWFNVAGCFFVMALAFMFSKIPSFGPASK